MSALFVEPKLNCQSVANALSCSSSRVKYTCMDCSSSANLMMFGASSGSVYVYDLVTTSSSTTTTTSTTSTVRSMCSFPEIKESIRKVCFAFTVADSTTKQQQQQVSMAAVCCAHSVFVVDLGLTASTAKPRVVARLSDAARMKENVTDVIWATALDDSNIQAVYFGDSAGNVFCAVRESFVCCVCLFRLNTL